jgi:site-specific DNA-cytosine methylase
MWVLPKNYQLSSAFAADMVESKEDLKLQGLDIEQSLMWRSKPSPLKTWCRRWKEDSFLPHLFTRISKPSQHKSFETKLTSSLEDILANRFHKQEKEQKTTQGICGNTSENIWKQLDLIELCSKTSKDTYRLDSPQSLATWKKMVTTQRGEYSVRVKLAHTTRERESLSWPTPATRDYKGGHSPENCKAKNRNPMTNSLPDAVRATTDSKALNPDWVEKLMGVPRGWTALDGNSNEWQNNWSGDWEGNTPRTTDIKKNRTDRIRMLGNAVVPATAAKAWTVLSARLNKG